MRGLESLIPQKKESEKDDKISPSESVFMIEVDKIKPNPFQPRKEFDEGELNDLTESIKQVGVIQPIIVTKIEKDTPSGRDVEYELIAGERRLRASQAANLPRVPVVIRRRTTTPEKLALSVVENIQRQDLNPVEEARAFDRLNKQFKMSAHDMSQHLGKHPAVIKNAIRMLRLPQDMLTAIEEKKMPMVHSRFLLMLSSYPDKQRKLFDEIVRRNFDAVTANRRVKELLGMDASAKALQPKTHKDAELDDLTEKLKDTIGTHNIKLSRVGRRTKLLVEFPSKGQMLEWLNKSILS
jgi:ParB family transcriptional regulator, chromosome partitioning protein